MKKSLRENHQEEVQRGEKDGINAAHSLLAVIMYRYLSLSLEFQKGHFAISP